jgi:hypothetical protein
MEKTVENIIIHQKLARAEIGDQPEALTPTTSEMDSFDHHTASKRGDSIIV